MKGVINRLIENKVETLGRFYLYDGYKQVFSCVVLELPDRQNQTSISRICAGVYKCKRRWSEKFKWHYILEDVDGRELILIHFGNYFTDTRGCLIFGNDFAHINKDEYPDVTSSKKTMKKLLDFVGDEFELTINEI